MMRAMTRVFFGVRATEVPRDTHLGELAIRYDGHTSWDRTLRYSNNAMDVLTVPVPGTPTGPPEYDNETLVLSKTSSGGSLVYDLTIATARDRAALVLRSKKVGGHFVMSSGRKFGVY